MIRSPARKETSLDRIKDTAIQAAREAGAVLIRRLGNIAAIDYKSAFNLVTDVDKASEALILEIIGKNFPEDQIIAEESGVLKASSERRWFIDPLDGTTNYAHSYPFFSVSIGVEVEGKPVLAVVFNPFSNELFFAEKGKGAWLGETAIKVSANSTLATSLLATGFPPDTKNARHPNMNEFQKLTDLSHGVRRDGSAALDLSFVACGRLDAFWEYKLAPWDLAAGTLIVTEAGGKVTSPNGGNFDINSGHVLASNGLIHDEVLKALQGRT